MGHCHKRKEEKCGFLNKGKADNPQGSDMFREKQENLTCQQEMGIYAHPGSIFFAKF